jgi:hypothetical protein
MKLVVVHRETTMKGLKLIAAALLGSGLTLALSSLAQAPRRVVTECPTPSVLYELELDVSKIGGRLDRIAADLDQISADQKATLDWTRHISSDLGTVKSDVLMISLKQGR